MTMSGVRILIIEDELLVAEQLKNTLITQGYEVLDIVDNAADAKRALMVYQLDIVLIDIKLRGEEDGISIAQHINQQHRLPIIFISSLIDQETVDRAKVCKPSAYLVKPYNASELYIALNMALFNFESSLVANPLSQQAPSQNDHYLINEHIFVRDKHRFERINIEDVLWLKAESSYVSIVTESKGYLLTTETLKSFLDKVSSRLLQRVHRSYAVNLQKVEAIEGNRLFVGEKEIPVSKNQLPELQAHFKFL